MLLKISGVFLEFTEIYMLSSQVKAESCKLLGNNSSILGIWADWGLGLGKQWLQWSVSHFNVSICHKKCWSERMLWIAGTTASVCTTVLSSMWLLICWAVLFPYGPRPVTVAVRRPWLCLRLRASTSACSFCVQWSGVGRSLLVWGLCSEPFHHAHPMETRENRVAGLCNRVLSCVGTRVSLSGVFPRTRTCLFSYTFNCASDWMSCVSAHCCLLFRADEKGLLTQTLVLVFRGCLLFPAWALLNVAKPLPHDVFSVALELLAGF